MINRKEKTEMQEDLAIEEARRLGKSFGKEVTGRIGVYGKEVRAFQVVGMRDINVRGKTDGT